ncbi:MAG: phytoene/squalene synthase family protein, partial [Bacteroidetes bacterium]|nr:phytoene/squalene synthase family protein [Bacteroidota bacterium]
MMHLFHRVSERCSRMTTEAYSTSFASAIRLLHPDLRQPVFNIYGFVRFADEIVDTFHGFDKQGLLAAFRRETYDALERGLSLNPILHSFQRTVRQYDIDKTLIEAFFTSMEMDLEKKIYDCGTYRAYIYGSAEAVGLMCLQIFCEGDKRRYELLEPAAKALGAAFQKINFLRDLKADYRGLERVYFPGCDLTNFTGEQKQAIEAEIEADFRQAYTGVQRLPVKAKLGVYVAYKYYLSLF